VIKTVVYGISNCDTVRKARAWLESHDIEYRFNDYRVDGLERVRLEKWVKAVGWEVLLNRAGTTFRKLPEARKQGLTAAKSISLMLEQPALIKRPVLERGAKLLVGFSPESYLALR
jgi:arsenate reductase